MTSEELEIEYEKLKQENSRLRTQFQALALDYIAEAKGPITSPTGRIAFSRCGKEIMLILNPNDELPTTPFATAET